MTLTKDSERLALTELEPVYSNHHACNKIILNLQTATKDLIAEKRELEAEMKTLAKWVHTFLNTHGDAGHGDFFDYWTLIDDEPGTEGAEIKRIIEKVLGAK